MIKRQGPVILSYSGKVHEGMLPKNWCPGDLIYSRCGSVRSRTYHFMMAEVGEVFNWEYVCVKNGCWEI